MGYRELSYSYEHLGGFFVHKLILLIDGAIFKILMLNYIICMNVKNLNPVLTLLMVQIGSWTSYSGDSFKDVK